MMDIIVKRTYKSAGCTLGTLTFGDFSCYTCEDVVRPMGVKVKGQTAIPAGKYQVVIDMSQRFGKEMPHVLNVPMFDGIRIHPGNTAADTEGCILLGKSKGKDSVLQSRDAFNEFFPKLQEVLKSGPVYLVIGD